MPHLFLAFRVSAESRGPLVLSARPVAMHKCVAAILRGRQAAKPLNATQWRDIMIAAGEEARRAEEPAVATPKMICALEGRHN